MLIIFSTATRRDRMRRGDGSVLRRIPCSGPKAGINSLLAQNNSLLVRGWNLSRSYWIRRCFRDGLSRKAAESAEFPAFFPATRELCTSVDSEFIRGKPPSTADRQGFGH